MYEERLGTFYTKFHEKLENILEKLKNFLQTLRKILKKCLEKREKNFKEVL